MERKCSYVVKLSWIMACYQIRGQRYEGSLDRWQWGSNGDCEQLCRRVKAKGDGGHQGGGGRRTHWGWSPHHSLGNKPAVYGQLLICRVTIPFYPQLNQQQNNSLHKRRKGSRPYHSIAHSAERETEKEVNHAGDDWFWGRRRDRERQRKVLKGIIP